ncbi:unnamed protein product [Spirodela intermedia]|uniref:Uncharacterized protein n=1 Tax=Spirodela intermedia TaxID=51605 RepID=A0A7I8LM42_SPIIN|nr:unnamed protein product [Spirodela intermedia]
MAVGSFTPVSSCSPGSSSSSTGNSAGDVEALLAEAADLVALEQIARLNTAHLSSEALLPADVESRFSRLKTFPAADPPRRCSSSAAREPPPPLEEDPPAGDKPDGGRLPEKKASGGAAASPEPFFPSPSPSNAGSPSPPRQRRACCFGFSPRKGGAATMRRKQDEDERHLSEAFRRRGKELWKAMRVEEEKVVREAKEMTRWMKQASAGMTLSTAAVEELLSDLEDEGNAKKKPSCK